MCLKGRGSGLPCRGQRAVTTWASTCTWAVTNTTTSHSTYDHIRPQAISCDHEPVTACAPDNGGCVPGAHGPCPPLPHNHQQYHAPGMTHAGSCCSAHQPSRIEEQGCLPRATVSDPFFGWRIGLNQRLPQAMSDGCWWFNSIS